MIPVIRSTLSGAYNRPTLNIRAEKYVYDAAIIGGGPAGLSAAIVLGRCLRSVILFDNNYPRNYAASHVNCYLGLEGPNPYELRARGREQARKYEVHLKDTLICSVKKLETESVLFEIAEEEGAKTYARKLILATGLKDCLPEIENAKLYYGKGVYHCPYCDGYENRNKKIAVVGEAEAAISLAEKLLNWSNDVSYFSNGKSLSSEEVLQIKKIKIPFHKERIKMLSGNQDYLAGIILENDKTVPCDALFFQGASFQKCSLAESLGCKFEKKNFLLTRHKQRSNVKGVFLAGDIDGDTQLAIVAAAEGAIAAMQAHSELQNEESAG